MHRKVVILVTVMFLMGMTASAEAAKRGKPGTKTRVDWCFEHRLACYEAGNTDCAKKYPFPNSATRKICDDAVTTSCENSWGDSCLNDPRLSDSGVTPPVLPGVLDPVRPTPRPPTYQKPGTLGGVFQRGVEGAPAPTGQETPAPK
jgi:hypothetical protein